MINLWDFILSDIGINDIILGNIIVFFGALLQCTTGMGLAIIVATGFLFINPAYVPTSVLWLALLLSVLNIYRFFNFIDYNKLAMMTFGRLNGIATALVFFGLFSTAKINIVIAFFIIIYSLITLFKWQISANKKNLFVGGLFSGFSGTIAAIGGPPVAIVLQNIPKQKFIGTITCYFVLGNIISLIALWTVDKVSLNHFLFAVLCIPSCGLGFWIAPYFSAKLSAKKFKLVIQIICILGGILLILKEFFLT